MSRQPAMAARKANDQQFVQNVVDRNEVEKARMEQIKSLKQIAKGYGASSAQVESSSFGELQGFVKRLEIERADETREQETRQREMQMRQSQQAMLAGAEKMDREAKERQYRQKLFSGLLASPGTEPTQAAEDLTAEISGARNVADNMLSLATKSGASPETIDRMRANSEEKLAAFTQRLQGPDMSKRLPSSAEQMFPGRPQVQAFLRKSVEEGQDPELAFGMAAKMADALPSREVALRAAMSGGGSTSGSGYFFSESEAVQAYEQAARSQGITPTKEQTDAFVASANVKDLEKIRSAAVRTVKRFQLDTAKDVIGTSERLEKMILDIERDPVTGAVISGGVKTLVARLFEPVGILTEDDKNQYAGAGGFKTKVAQMWDDLMTGTLTDEQIPAIRAAVRILEEDAKETLRDDGEKAVRSVASGYGISLQDAVSRTALAEYLLSPEADPAQPNQSQTSNQPGRTTIPGTNATFKRN
jgi:hypothetical protein